MTTAPITTHIDKASFSIWTKDEIKQVSVKKITEPKSFEKAGAMHPDGLYSPCLGPVKRFELCPTCEQTTFNCPGHYGHLELAVPVYHPMLVQIMYQMLSKCCLECFHFRLSQPMLKLFLAQLEALNCGFDHLIDELDEIAADMCKDDKGEGDSYLHVTLGQKLMARIQEEKDKIPDFDCKKRPQQRSIVERLSKLYRNFINGQLIKPLKLCPHCHEKKATLTLYQQSVLVFGSNKTDDGNTTSSKKSKGSAKKKKKKPDISSMAGDGLDLKVLKTDEKKFLTPIGARYYFRQLWKNEKRTLQRIFHFLNLDNRMMDEAESIGDKDDPKEKLRQENLFQPVDLFFIDTILVPPSKFRPPMSQRGYSFEGPRTAALSLVMKQSVVVQDMIDRIYGESDEIEAEKLQPKLQSSWKELQTCVNCLYDNEMDKYGKRQYPGLKQLIDKKEGLFRKNMMGKRVNFAARSVISPDPNILVDQIGVPLVFAKKLTYPQPVTPFNIQQLKEAVLNGPDKYPGAMSIVYDDGMTVSLAKESVRQHIAARLSYNPRPSRNRNKPDTHMATVVNRHLLTGDVLLFNRQPTLHKPSIMAFRARVLPNEKGFRLHYANCKSFNADFDGDEMNAHLPQSELARSEAYHIASVNYQYLVPKDGSPLGGLIQDHVVAVCIMTRRDQFFDKERYHQLVYCALEFLDRPLKLEKPTILRPKQLWTGKQVITTMIKNCIPQDRLPPTLDIKSKIGPKILNIKPEYEELSDCHVVIRNGELMVGFMDKSNVGATQYGLIHTCYELYGGETSSNLMSAFARLSTWYLQFYEGFTLGIADILVEDDANQDRQNSITASLTVGPNSAKEALGLTGDIQEEELEERLRGAHSDRNPLPMKKLDASMKSRTDKIASEISGRCLPEGLIRRFPDNNLQMMIQSGAKGGTVNALQISCLLGQIELEGRRVPLSMSGRSLPSFKPYDTSPKAGGFVSGRFLTGIQPQEFFFHCMAGREGLIDTAVKTSRSGYLQRCLIKHLEGLTVQYDQTVRDSCGSVIQFLYGEDGLDIVKSQMLKDKAFPSIVENNKIIGPSQNELAMLNKAKEEYEDEVIARTNEIQQWLEKNGDDRIRKIRGSGFLDYLTTTIGNMKQKDVAAAAAAKAAVDRTVPVTPQVEPLNDYGEATEMRVEQEPAESDEPKPVGEYVKQHELSAEEESEMKQLGDESKIETSISKPITDDNGASSATTTTTLNTQTPFTTTATAELSSSQKEDIRLSVKLMLGSNEHDHVFQSWYALSFKEKRKWNKQWELCPDPLTAIMNPASHFGVVPEKLDQRIEAFVRKNPHLVVDSASLFGESNTADGGAYIAYDENPELSKSILTHWNQSIVTSDKPKLTRHEFYNLCYNLYMKMLAQPGEAVGLLAAQSIGEPSTQMTLNTFHFAGRGEMNVTLGIPRLREILMTASAKIGTPSMDLPLLKVMRDEFGVVMNEEAVEEQAKRVKLALNAVRLSDVLEYVDVTEQVIKHSFGAPAAEGGGSGRKNPRKRPRQKSEVKLETDQSVRYQITFALLPSKYYKHEFKSNSGQILKFIEDVFVGHLIDSMIKRQRRLLMADDMYDLSAKKMNRERIVRGGGGGGGGAGDGGGANGDIQDDPEEEDLDNYNAKAQAKEKVSKEDESSSDEDEDGEGDNTTQRLKSRRNQDLDYEEPEDDDLEVDGGDAKAAAVEEDDREIIGEEEPEEQSRSPEESAASASGMMSAKGNLDVIISEKSGNGGSKKLPVDDLEAEEEGEDDELTVKVKREYAIEQALDERPAGQNFELAGFEDSNAATRSGFPSPVQLDGDNEEATAIGQQRKQQMISEEPLEKRKRIDLSEVDGKVKVRAASKFDEATISNRIQQVKLRPYVLDYEFDVKRERWCKLTICLDLTTTRLDMGALIEAEARRTYVHRVGNIQRALIVKDINAKSRGAKCDKMIKTEGVSLLSLVRFNHILDLNAIYTNDIHAIANTYGIEAASQAIRREMANVFAVYGIEVDSRHLSLIADYMTYNGSIRGMNRMSMEASASPFQQMSYESTIRYLKWAAILGLYDDIKSPSAALVFGRPTRGGTGLFSMISDSKGTISATSPQQQANVRPANRNFTFNNNNNDSSNNNSDNFNNTDTNINDINNIFDRTHGSIIAEPEVEEELW